MQDILTTVLIQRLLIVASFMWTQDDIPDIKNSAAFHCLLLYIVSIYPTVAYIKANSNSRCCVHCLVSFLSFIITLMQFNETGPYLKTHTHNNQYNDNVIKNSLL